MTTRPERQQQVEREHLLMFIHACLSCTGQREFYDDVWGQMPCASTGSRKWAWAA